SRSDRDRQVACWAVRVCGVDDRASLQQPASDGPVCDDLVAHHLLLPLRRSRNASASFSRFCRSAARCLSFAPFSSAWPTPGAPNPAASADMMSAGSFVWLRCCFRSGITVFLPCQRASRSSVRAGGATAHLCCAGSSDPILPAPSLSPAPRVSWSAAMGTLPL